MKRIFLVLLVCFCGFLAKSQTPFTTPNYGFSSKLKLMQVTGGLRADSGFIVAPRFTDTATANLSVVSLYGGMLIRILDTLWMRNEAANAWVKQRGDGSGCGSSETWQDVLINGSTLSQNNTISGGNYDLKFNNTDFYVGNLGGDNEKVVWTDNDGLLFRTTFAILSDSLNPYITGLQNGVVSGCTVTWIENYDYEVSPCVYRIAGTVYEIASTTDITLSAADPTNDRIDVFYVNTSSAAGVVEGTPASPAEEPDIDVSTQLKISFAIVEAATTEPTLAIDDIYKENTGPPAEWTYSDNTTNLNPASTTNPYAGTYDIEGTTVAAANRFTMTVSPTPAFTDYVYLNFKIRSKASWPSGRVLAIQFFSGATPLGSSVTFGQGTYGFQSTQTATYQNISIPLGDFGDITGATAVRFLRNGTGTIGFYIDNIILLEARSYYLPGIDNVVGIAPISVSQSGNTAAVSLDANGVTNSYIRQSAGLSVIGNSTNSTANVADITAGTDHYVLRRSGTALGFGTLNAAAMNATYSNGQFLTTDGSGGLSWAAAAAGGITSLNGLTGATQTFGNDVNVTMVSSGTTHTLTWAGTLADSRIASAATWNAKEPAITWSQGDILYGTGANTYTQLAKSASATRYLSNTGTSNNPAWAQVDLSNGVTGLLPLANGGTNANLTASDGGIFYSTATAGAILSGTATANKVLMSGASGAPSWSVPTFPNASATTRKVIVSDGTNWTASTETYAVPGTTGNVLTSDGTNWTSAAPAAGGVTTLAAIGSSPNANGGTISGSTYNQEPASISFGGVLSAPATAQVIGGVKTFTGNSNDGLTINGAWTSTATAQRHVYFNPVITTRNTASDTIIGVSLRPSFTPGNSGTQINAALMIDPFNNGSWAQNNAILHRGDIRPLVNNAYNIGNSSIKYSSIFVGTVAQVATISYSGTATLGFGNPQGTGMTLYSHGHMVLGEGSNGTTDAGYMIEAKGDVLGRSLTSAAIATPTISAVTPTGVTGATTYTYVVVARMVNGSTATSAAVTTTTGNATLTGSNYNALTWGVCVGAYVYDVYRTVGGASQGLIVTRTQGATAYNDIGAAGSGATPPASSQNNTGGIKLAGEIISSATITAAATVGAQTINKPAGSVNFAAAATSLVVTNNFVGTTSLVFCQIMTNDLTATSCQVVVAAGSFTIYLNAAATAETKVAFHVVNTY